MIPGSLARRYARALMLLAETAMQRETFGRGLSDFTNAIKVEDGSGSTLGGVLDSQRYPLSERRAVLTSVCRRLGVDATVLSFLTYVLERGRISGVAQIARFYGEMADELAGRVHASVRSARPLTPDATLKLTRALEQATGRTVVLESSVDPALIGGVVCQVGSMVVDGSVQTQLETLRTTLSGT
ncbi:MAG: ATP synthase F1 subunit delta [Myxococcales bacterium]|nr:ATP synthase F1 subunit delta [Myxococcales bacterium]